MSLDRIRLGVRIAAAVIGLAGIAAAGYGIGVAHADAGTVIDGMTFVAVVVIGWVLVEAVVGGFEQIQRIQPDAHAVAAQAVCETLRVLHEQAVEDSPKISILHR